MNTYTLSATHDPMGQAISDYYKTGRAARLRVLSSMFEEDEMPVDHLFRTYADMPPLERRAIDMASGRTLDIGAGAGCHAYELQKRGTDVKAIDISPLSCATMTERGIKDVECINLFSQQLSGKYDTLLLLMNGTGIAGKLRRLPVLLNRLKQLMADDNAQILVDSSDIRYVYEDDGIVNTPTDSYYGETDFRMAYRNVMGETFNWLYVDKTMLTQVCRQCSLNCEIVAEGQHYDYLARITTANN